MDRPGKSACLFRAWVHSYEEDTHDVTVYRTVAFDFPLSRVRDGVEFRADGTVVHSGPGPDDRPQEIAGVWEELEADTLGVRMSAMDPTPRRMTVVDCNDQVLKVRWGR